MDRRLLTERDVEREYGISVRTAQGWRLRGGGPQFLRLGRAVRYERDALERWLAARRYRTTSAPADDAAGVSA